MWAIIKKEVKSYFLSPIGYVFIGLFLIMCSVFFYLDVINYGTTNFSNLFYSAATILTFIVPILTMRMFSEERKNGTEVLLLTSPRSITKIVLGKFIASIIVLAIAILSTLMFYIILLFFGRPHLLTSLNTLFGFLLLGIAYISFGMFASSITENQIISAVVTIGFLILTWFLPYFSKGFEVLSLINMFDKFPSGQFAIDEVITFISFSALFVLLTIIVMQRRKTVK